MSSIGQWLQMAHVSQTLLAAALTLALAALAPLLQWLLCAPVTLAPIEDDED